MASALDTALNIVKDPALPALVNRITVLRDLEVADIAEATGQPVPPSTTPGIGLHRAVTALDLYIWFRKNRWVAGVAVGALIFVPGLFGFALGRFSSTCTPKATKSLRGVAPRRRPRRRR